jgi:hypothetical protein
VLLYECEIKIAARVDPLVWTPGQGCRVNRKAIPFDRLSRAREAAPNYLAGVCSWTHSIENRYVVLYLQSPEITAAIDAEYRVNSAQQENWIPRLLTEGARVSFVISLAVAK